MTSGVNIQKMTLGQVPLAFVIDAKSRKLASSPLASYLDALGRDSWRHFLDALGRDVHLTDMWHKNGTVRFRKRSWVGLQNVRFSDTQDKNGTRTPVSWVEVLCCLTHPPPQPTSLRRFLVFYTTHYSLSTTYSYSAGVKLLLCPVRSVQTLKGDFCVCI